MRQLLPEPPAEVDPFESYGDPRGDWLRVGMVMSVDGSITDEDRWTDTLGGAADLRVFRTLRALSDGIMVGANTVRTGRVGPHRPTGELRARRTAAGRPPTAPIIVVTRSLALDWSHRLFTEAATIVVTCAAAVAARPTPAPARLVVAGDTGVDLAEAVRRLRTDLGLRHLLCEGGPTLATGLIDHGLVDELCLTLAPTLLGAAHHTTLFRVLAARVDLTLSALYQADGAVFARYRARNRAR